MQNKNVITAILASMLVFLAWMTLAPKLFPHLAKNDRRLTTQPAEPELPSDSPPQSTVASTQPTSSPSSLPASNGGVPQAVVTGGPEIENVVLGDASADSPYPMRLELTANGASVSSAHIRGHYETVKGKESYPALAPSVVALSELQQQVFYSFTTVKLRLKGDGFQYDAPLEHVNWKLRDQSSSHVAWEAEIADAQNRPLARISKAYELAPQTRESLTSDVTLKIDIQNLTAAPMSAILVQRGPMGMKREDERSEDRRLVSAHWDGTELKSQTIAANKGKDLPDLGQDSDNVVDQTRSRIAWAAEANKYFTAVMAPASRMNAQVPALFAKVHPLHLVENQDKDESAGSMTFQYITQPLTISPNASASVGFDLYIGPKLKRAFDKVAVYKDRDYYQIIGAFYYFCAPAALVELMVKLLNMFHAIWPHNYGLAIILLVILVRTILHPITKRSQVNMTRMQKNMSRLQPKIAAIKEKYANDRMKLNQATMEVYREEGINPAGNILNCLPMMLQIPIWGALFTGLAYCIDMRHQPFDGYWIKDLTAQDAIISFRPTMIPIFSWLLGGPISSFNLLPILLCVSQILQTRFMPQHAPQQPGQPDQRKMMMWMSVLFIFFFYNAPSGLNLYIMASNLFGLLEQWRIRQHIAVLDAKAEEERKTRGSAEPAKHTWLQRKWKELEKQVEQAKKVESQRRTKK